MLSQRERLAAITLASMADGDREHALRRGYVMVNLERDTASSGLWTPINLNSSIIEASEDFRRTAELGAEAR